MSIPIKTIVAFACLSLVTLPAVADVWGDIDRPLPPMALRVTTSDAGNMLSWEPPLADTGAPLEAYNVYRLVNGVQESLGSVGASTTSYMDSDVTLDGNTTYAYFVTSESAAGESVPSNLAAQPYPWCLDFLIFGPDVEVNWKCILPLPVGPLTLFVH